MTCILSAQAIAELSTIEQLKIIYLNILTQLSVKQYIHGTHSRNVKQYIHGTESIRYTKRDTKVTRHAANSRHENQQRQRLKDSINTGRNVVHIWQGKLKRHSTRRRRDTTRKALDKTWETVKYSTGRRMVETYCSDRQVFSVFFITLSMTYFHRWLWFVVGEAEQHICLSMQYSVLIL